MRIFDLPKHMESILSAVEEGREPDENEVRSLTEEGPSVVDDWCRAIGNLEAKKEALTLRIRELRQKRDKTEKDEAKMRTILQEIVTGAFNGKVQTHEFTVWIQDGVLRIRK